jgi:hypothetical protein
MTSLTSTNVFTISCLSIEPPPPKFSSTARWKALQSLYCTIRRLFVLFVDYSRTIRTIRGLFADYSHYSSTIRGLFVLFVDYSLHYSSFINCPLYKACLQYIRSVFVIFGLFHYTRSVFSHYIWSVFSHYITSVLSHYITSVFSHYITSVFSHYIYMVCFYHHIYGLFLILIYKVYPGNK